MKTATFITYLWACFVTIGVVNLNGLRVSHHRGYLNVEHNLNTGEDLTLSEYAENSNTLLKESEDKEEFNTYDRELLATGLLNLEPLTEDEGTRGNVESADPSEDESTKAVENPIRPAHCGELGSHWEDAEGKMGIVMNLMKLKEKNMCTSFKHQKKFFEMKDKTILWLKKYGKTSLLYEKPKSNFAIAINDKYAYRHIFKNGGTTVMAQVNDNRGHIDKDNLEGRKLFAAVRDPIDHFLSGWAECGSRLPNVEENPAYAPSAEINSRIQNFLHLLKSCTELNRIRKEDDKCICVNHAFPQANFLYDDETKVFHTSLDLVGDLGDLAQLMEVARFKYDYSVPRARSATKNRSKKGFPKDITLLSDETTKKLCRYLTLDYYLLDFEPPEVCRDQISSDIKMIRDMPLVSSTT